MTFKTLYDYSCSIRQFPVKLEGVLDTKVIELTAQDEIYYVPLELDPEISLGHIKQYRISNGVYDQNPNWVTEIRYFGALNDCWKRFVCCKELMHVFDTKQEQTDTPAKFQQLLEEIEAAPLPAAASSDMFKSETKTKWMALAVLCPAPVRDELKPKWESKELSDYGVALDLRIPETYIRTLMSDRFEEVIGILLE